MLKFKAFVSDMPLVRLVHKNAILLDKGQGEEAEFNLEEFRHSGRSSSKYSYSSRPGVRAM